MCYLQWVQDIMGEGLVGRQRNQEARRVGSILNQSDQRGKITDEGENGMRRSKREYIIRGRIEGRKSRRKEKEKGGFGKKRK